MHYTGIKKNAAAERAPSAFYTKNELQAKCYSTLMTEANYIDYRDKSALAVAVINFLQIITQRPNGLAFNLSNHPTNTGKLPHYLTNLLNLP